MTLSPYLDDSPQAKFESRVRKFKLQCAAIALLGVLALIVAYQYQYELVEVLWPCSSIKDSGYFCEPMADGSIRCTKIEENGQ